MLPLRPVTRWCLILSLCAPAAWAQADLPDAGLPPVVVDEEGAQRASEESDTSAVTCLSANDCDRGFACTNGKCTYRRYRDATYEGCGAETTSGLWVLGALLLARPRRGYFLLKFTK